MTRRIGLLSLSMAALGLAVSAYFVQGAGAVSPEPVAVADFSAPQSAVAQASGGDEYDLDTGESALFHPTNTASPSCEEGSGFGLIKLSDEVALLCKGGDVIGFLVTAAGEEPKFVKDLPAKQECPSAKGEHQPDA